MFLPGTITLYLSGIYGVCEAASGGQDLIQKYLLALALLANALLANAIFLPRFIRHFRQHSNKK